MQFVVLVDPSYCGSGPHRHKSLEEHLIESEKAWLVVASSIHMGAALHTQNTQIRIRFCVRHQQPGPAHHFIFTPTLGALPSPPAQECNHCMVFSAHFFRRGVR